MADIVVRLIRTSSGDEGTFGTLYYPGGICYTLELPDRGNAPRISSIPVGEYECRKVFSPKFGEVYHVTDVPGRSAILIHSGNFGGAVDKGFDSHVLGCILLGERCGRMKNAAGYLQRAILVSRPAVRAFMNAMKGRDFLLSVESQC